VNRRPCEIRSASGPKKDKPCEQDAVAFLSYYLDGQGGVVSCAGHMTQAMKVVAEHANQHAFFTLKVRPIGALSEQIDAAHAKRAEESSK
jgi:hypothetical protein